MQKLKTLCRVPSKEKQMLIATPYIHLAFLLLYKKCNRSSTLYNQESPPPRMTARGVPSVLSRGVPIAVGIPSGKNQVPRR